MSASFPASSEDNNGSSPLSASAFTLASRLRSETDDDEVHSLPSGPASDSSLDADFDEYSSDEESDAEEEWRESMHQLELLSTMVIIPFVGKFLGRKCAYWGWGKFMEWKYPIEVVIGSGGPSNRQKTLASL